MVAGLELVFGLVAHADGGDQAAAEFGYVVVFVGRDRVFVPVKAEVVSRASDVERLAEVVAVVGVEHEFHFVAGYVADAGHHLEDAGGVHDARVYLIGAESGGAYLLGLAEVAFGGLVSGRVGGVNFGLVAARAEQFIDGDAGGLARYVPEGYVHGRPGVHAESAPPAEDGQAVPESFALEGVSVYQLGLEDV